jgi:hypothetical protein
MRSMNDIHESHTLQFSEVVVSLRKSASSRQAVNILS